MSEHMKLPDAIRTALTSRLGPVQFSDLKAHIDRDAVFVARRDLDLVECGVAVAMDDLERVQPRLDARQLRKPSQQERSSWAAAPERRWLAVVVQPFVLVQDTTG
jgi:hypothetical protein